MKICILVSLFFTVACAHHAVSHDERALDHGNEFSEDENKLCSQYPCQYFIAPCRLRSESHKTTTSAIEDRYLDRSENLRQQGYCAPQIRPITNDEYSHETCFFLFIKQEKCPS